MNIRTVHIAAAAAALLSSQACAITVEVAPGEPECVRRAAAGLRADLDRACPGHGADTRRIVVRTVRDGRWEASVREYADGEWTVTGSDPRGTVFGIYAISEELGVNAFHWLDDVPVEPREFLDGWARRFLGPSNAALAPRIAAHLAEYYRLGTIRKPELMCWQWISKLTDAEKKSLMAQYAALAAEDIAIEAELAKQWKDPWFETVGFQARFLAEAGMAFMSDDILEEGAKDRLKPRFAALNERYESVFGGKWRRFWFDTIDEKEWWCQGGNNWASQMQWPWKEPGDRRKWHIATAGGDGIAEKDWKDAADFIRKSPANGGSWECVAGLGISAKAMALLPVVEGAGKGAWMEYEIEGKGEMATGNGELVLQFLPDYRLYPGMKLRVEVSVNGSEWQSVEVPFSDGTKDENSPGRYVAVQDSFVRAFVKCPLLKEGVNTIRVRAVDPGAVLDRIAVRN